jgi:hypothetical protein
VIEETFNLLDEFRWIAKFEDLTIYGAGISPDSGISANHGPLLGRSARVKMGSTAAETASYGGKTWIKADARS